MSAAVEKATPAPGPERLLAPPGEEPAGWALPLLLASFLVAAALASVAIPIWEAPDETEHFQYTVYLAEHHAIPSTLPSIQRDGNSEAKQPPLYYLLTLPATFGVDVSDAVRIRPNPHAWWPTPDGRYAAVHTLDEGWPYHGSVLAAHRARLVSALLGTLTVALTYGVALACTGSRGTALGAAGLLVALPGFLFGSATIDNDALADAISAALLFLVVRPWRGQPDALPLLFGGVSALGILGKLNAVVPIALGLAALLAQAGARRRLRTAALALLPLLPAVAYWAWRVANGERRLLGRLIGWPALPGSAGPLDWSVAATYAQHLWISFVGQYGWQSIPLPTLVYAPYGVVFGVGLAFALWATLAPRSGAGRLRQGALLWALPPAAITALVATYMLVTESRVGIDNARLVYPALPAVATLVAYGWGSLTAGLRFRAGLTAVAIAAGVCLAAAIPWVYLRPLYPAPWPVSDQAPPTATPVAAAQFGSLVSLAAVALPSRTFTPGTGAFATFYWRVSGPPPPSEWLFVHVEDARGRRAAAFDGAPNSDTLPLASWRPGDVVEEREVLTFHRDAPPGAYTLRVGWYDPTTGRRLALPTGATELVAALIQVVAAPPAP